MATDDVKRRAGLYGVLREISRLAASDPVREALENAPESGGMMTGERRAVSVDEEWLDACEGAMEHFGRAIEQSRSLIKKDGEVVRINRAKRPSKDSVTHLARHSNLIKSVTDDGTLAPEEIYINQNDEDLAVYENRFLYLALTYTQDFISHRYDGITRASAEAGVSLRFDRNYRTQSGAVSYGLSMSETSTGSGDAANLAEQQTIGRIRALLNTVSGYLQSSLMKTVSSAPKLTPPVVRTNIIKNNVHFAAIYDLYSYLTSYQGDGFELKNDAKGERTVDERTAAALSDIAALQFFVACQGAFDGWEDSESAYGEELDEKHRQTVRRLRLDVEAAREKAAAGTLSDKEYIELLEKSNAMLAEEYERAGLDISDLRRKDRQSRGEIIKLSAERDMMRDRLEQTVKKAEERIRENAQHAEREYSARADERIRRREEELAEQRSEWQRENDLLTARLRAEGLIKESAFEDIDDRGDFIKLEDEYAALGEYYRKQWTRMKKLIRSREWKNSKDGGEGGQ